MKRALFLDRDGVINKDTGYVSKISEFEFIDGIFDLCRHSQDIGCYLFVITNQAGIARGYHSEEDFKILNDWMLRQFRSQGVTITKVYYCPHFPRGQWGRYRLNCFCRKPQPGMILQAQKEFFLDLQQCILIGDKESDLEAGINAGIIHNYLVRTTYVNLQTSKATKIFNDIKELTTYLESNPELKCHDRPL